MALKNIRLLVIDASEAEDNNYDKAFEKALKTGIDAISLTIYWDDFKKKPGKYKPAMNGLEIENVHYAKSNLEVASRISVIDTNQKRLSKELHFEQIEFISFTWLSDSSADSVSAMQSYHGSKDVKFVCFLESLGLLRTSNGSGQDERAHFSLLKQASLRGWE